MHSIWQKNRSYSFLRPYVDACTRASYRWIKMKGTIPEGKAVILSPNHTNTLMDALVVLQSRRAETVFGARADIFRKPVAARALRFLRILPLARQRDGLREVLNNHFSFEEIDETLANGVPFCIFPEGRHRTMHSLLPIGKGIARIALVSAAVRPTFIVPAGIEYGDWFRYRQPCTLTYGEPLDVNAFVEANRELGEADLYRALREEIGRRMSQLILYLPDDETYPERWAAIEQARRKPAPWWKWPVLAVTFPFFAASAVLTLPMWLTAELIPLKDKAWRNSIRFLLRLVGTPLMLLVWALVLLLTCPWPAAVAALVYFLFSYSIFYDWLNLLHR